MIYDMSVLDIFGLADRHRITKLAALQSCASLSVSNCQAPGVVPLDSSARDVVHSRVNHPIELAVKLAKTNSIGNSPIDRLPLVT